LASKSDGHPGDCREQCHQANPRTDIARGRKFIKGEGDRNEEDCDRAAQACGN
jgi:hypothetical protein